MDGQYVHIVGAYADEVGFIGESAGDWNDVPNNPTQDIAWGAQYEINKGIAEIPLTLEITQSATPKEGAGTFTTSINLSAGSSTNLANGSTVYWQVTGISNDDLASGNLTGSGTITDGKLDVQHSLIADSDSGEIFQMSVYSDWTVAADRDNSIIHY